MWGAQEKSEEAHQNFFGRCALHLQIASDATVIITSDSRKDMFYSAFFVCLFVCLCVFSFLLRF